jgi:hypothetical protein
MSDFVKVPAGEPIPLSILELDLPAPTIGWAAGLAEKGIGTVLDDLGRLCVSRANARRLFEEKRAAEEHAREVRARNERAAVEADRVRRASMPKGLAWHEVPIGLTPAEAMVAGDPDRDKRRKNPVAAMFDGDSMVVHSIHDDGDEFVARGNPEFFHGAS